MDMVALPFCQIVLKAKKPLSPAYPKSLNTIGNHIRKRRLDLKLTQKQVAEKIGVSETSLMTWERNQHSPNLRFIPKIIEFLGYLPANYNKKPETIKEKILHYRQIAGLNQKQLAKLITIDPETLSNWERDIRQPTGKPLEKLNKFFNSFHPKL